MFEHILWKDFDFSRRKNINTKIMRELRWTDILYSFKSWNTHKEYGFEHFSSSFFSLSYSNFFSIVSKIGDTDKKSWSVCLCFGKNMIIEEEFLQNQYKIENLRS